MKLSVSSPSSGLVIYVDKDAMDKIMRSAGATVPEDVSAKIVSHDHSSGDLRFELSSDRVNRGTLTKHFTPVSNSPQFTHRVNWKASDTKFYPRHGLVNGEWNITGRELIIRLPTDLPAPIRKGTLRSGAVPAPKDSPAQQAAASSKNQPRCQILICVPGIKDQVFETSFAEAFELSMELMRKQYTRVS